MDPDLDHPRRHCIVRKCPMGRALPRLRPNAAMELADGLGWPIASVLLE